MDCSKTWSYTCICSSCILMYTLYELVARKKCHQGEKRIPVLRKLNEMAITIEKVLTRGSE